jgi:hypothetical protein
MEVLTIVDRFTALPFTVRCITSGCEAHTNFADESICLLTDDVRNEVGTIHRSQVDTLEPAVKVLVYPLKLYCRNICTSSVWRARKTDVLSRFFKSRSEINKSVILFYSRFCE